MEQLYMQQQRTTLTAGVGQSIVTRAHYAYLTPAEYQALNEHMRGVAIRTHTLGTFQAHTHQACGLIEGTASRLGFPRRTIATAQLLYTRFHLTYSPSDFLLHEVSLACLVLSSKICDTPKRTRDMIVTSYALRHPEKCKITTSVAVPAAQARAAKAALSAGREYIPTTTAASSSAASQPRARTASAPTAGPNANSSVNAARLMGTIAESDIDPARIENERGRILAIERLLLETTSFNFQIRAQNALALSFKLGRRLRAPRSLCDAAWRIAADAHRSPAPLIYPPLTIALASLYLAALFAFPPLKTAVDSAHTDEADNVADQQYYSYMDPCILRTPTATTSSGRQPVAPSQRGFMGASILGSSARSRPSGPESLTGSTGTSSGSSRYNNGSSQQHGDGGAAGGLPAGLQREAARLIMCFTASDGLFGDASTRPGGANRKLWKAQCELQQKQQRQAQLQKQPVSGTETSSGGQDDDGHARKRRKLEGSEVAEGSGPAAPAVAAMAAVQLEDERMGSGALNGLLAAENGSTNADEGLGGDALADEALWLALGSSSGSAHVESAAIMILDLYIESLRLLSSSPPFSGPLPVQPAHLAAGTTTSNTIVTSAKLAPPTGIGGDDMTTPSPFSPVSPQIHGSANLSGAGEDDKTTTVVLVNTRHAPMPPSYALSPPPLEVLQLLNQGYGPARQAFLDAAAAGSGTGGSTHASPVIGSQYGFKSSSRPGGGAGQSTAPAAGPSAPAPAPPPSPLELLQELDQLKLWLLRIGRRRDRADAAFLASGPPASSTTTTTASENKEENEEREAAESYARRRYETAQWRRWSGVVALSQDEGRMRGIVPEDPVLRERFVGKGPVEYKQGVVRFLF
ncbi:hypothetical protein V8E36_006555 [Tilletia maclaganii]